LEVLKTSRTKDAMMPVLLLTVRDALENRIAGLDGGADDLVSFSDLEVNLTARRVIPWR
jgi:two-component system, OmpR family, response regulator